LSRELAPHPRFLNLDGPLNTGKSQSDADQLEAATDQAIAACGGDARGILLPRDRKDWYD
jgi:hypothetical protein